MGALFGSVGLKRKIAAFLTLLLSAVSMDPRLAPLLPFITYLAGIFGLTGIAQAAKKKTLKKYKTLSLAAFLALVHAAVLSVPALLPYQSLIGVLASLVSLLGIAVDKKPLIKTAPTP